MSTDISPLQSVVESLEPRALLSTTPAPSHLLANVPEAAKYKLVYDLNVPLLGGNFAKSAVPYSVNNAATTKSNFDRVAYYMELKKANGQTQWVYASFKTLTADAKKIGVPTAASGAFFQGKVSSLNVFSNVRGVVTGTGLAGGNIEFWPKGYGPNNAAKIAGASSTLNDFGDQTLSNLPAMGSMQIHNAAAKQTLFAYNDWGGAHPSQQAEIGIGNAPSGSPDWTGANNAGQYTVRRIQVLVHPASGTPTSPPPVSPPPVSPPPPVITHSLGRVLALGDSITWGYSYNQTPSGGYRSRLYTDLTNAGYGFQYVGSISDANPSVLQQAHETLHEGHGGYTTDQVLGNLLGEVPGSPVSPTNGGHWLDGNANHPAVNPDIILLHIGTNDFIHNQTVESAAANLDQIVQTLTTQRPDARLFLSSIIPLADPALNTSVIAYNNLIRTQIVPKYQALGAKVTFVDQYANFVDASGNPVTSSFADGVHPTRAGYDKIGDTWAAAIKAVYQSAGLKK